MTDWKRLLLSSVLLGALAAARASPAEAPVAAAVETTLRSAQDQIRQLAFDGDAETFFASAERPASSDHFTLIFEKPVALKSLAVLTGRPDGSDRLDAGILEASADGKTFDELARFADGRARGEPKSAAVRAIRIRPGAEPRGLLVVREIEIVSEPPIAQFRYPVEFVVDVSDAPEMKEWAENAARVCERAYPMISEELRSDGFQPPRFVTMTLKTSYRGVAATSGRRITGSVKFFKEHPDDVGAMVHETVHVVQRYRSRGNPGWLVEGVADYVRFFKFEPGKLRPLNPERARYNQSYKVTAAFLAYLTETYDKEIVRKLNRVMREGRYKEEVFQELTGKPLQDLGEEWRESLRPKVRYF
jgi:hypothetical protein